MSNDPTVIRTVGLNRLDGLGQIINIKLNCDMGDSGRAHYPVTIDLGDTEARFSWAHPTNGNVIYREKLK